MYPVPDAIGVFANALVLLSVTTFVVALNIAHVKAEHRAKAELAMLFTAGKSTRSKAVQL